MTACGWCHQAPHLPGCLAAAYPPVASTIEPVPLYLATMRALATGPMHNHSGARP